MNARVQVQVMGDRIELPEWPVRTPATPRDQCRLAGFSAPVPLYWRDDEHFTYVAAWEFAGDGKTPVLHREPLQFENVTLSQRSYK